MSEREKYCVIPINVSEETAMGMWRTCPADLQQTHAASENPQPAYIIHPYLNTDVAGWVGAVVFVGSALLINIGRLDPRGRLYPILNILAGLSSALNNFDRGALGPGSLNTTWSVIYSYGLWRNLYRNQDQISEE